jgi:hypothetical protein
MLRDIGRRPKHGVGRLDNGADDLLQLVDERGEVGRLTEPGAEEIEPGTHRQQFNLLRNTRMMGAAT